MPKETKFNNFLEQMEEEQKNIDIRLFSKYLPYEQPDRVVQVFHNSKSKADNNSEVSLIDASFKYFVDKVDEMPTGSNKSEEVKILGIVNKILHFHEQNQQGQGLKILTPTQMLSRLPIFLAQLKAGNNSEKLKNIIRQQYSYNHIISILCTDHKN